MKTINFHVRILLMPDVSIDMYNADVTFNALNE